MGHDTSSSAVRLAELLGSLSVTTDHMAGQPPESALSVGVVAVRLARSIGVPETDRAAIFYAALLRFIGCSATATEAAGMALGEETSLNYALTMSDWTDAAQVEAAMRAHFAPGVPDALRDAAIRELLQALPGIPSFASLHCLQAQILARRLPVPPGTSLVLSHMHARWDGTYPGASGEAVPIGERVIAVAVVAELMRRAAGVSSALALLELRAGRQLDPELCRCTKREAATLFAGLDGAARWHSFLDAEPAEPLCVTDVTPVAEAFADFVDHKCPWLLGHSRQVARLVFLAGEAMGMSLAERAELRLAALLHDVGRAAVPNAIWDRRGPLSGADRVKAESHSMATEQVLALAPSLARVREHAAAAHERADGRGYHRRVEIAGGAALIAASDVYDALTHERPWRPALERDGAADLMLAEAGAGKLPRAATRAVLDAAGHGTRTARQAYPAGLTQRQVEVMQLLARGLATKEIAHRLGISPKTADHHIQHIYDKCGARSRATVALFTIEHGLAAD